MENKKIITTTPVQEKLLASIAKQNASASELAKSTKTSLPYILSQLKLLEAKGILTRTITKKQGLPGKPRQEYSLTESIVKSTILRPGYSDKSDFTNDKSMQLFLQVYTQTAEEHKESISQYFWLNAPDMNSIRSLAKLNSSSKKIELIAITTKKYLEHLRKTISSHKTKTAKGIIDIACWVHTKDEFIEGIKNKDTYYLNLAKKMEILVDDYSEIKQIKEI